MAAVVGLPKQEVLRLVELHRVSACWKLQTSTPPIRWLSPATRTLSTRAVEAVKKEKRTRAVILPVSSAFHTSLMEPAKQALQARLDTVSPGSPGFPVIANVNAREYPASDQGVKQLLTEQVVRPFLWEDCIRVMRESGAETFVEIGP